MTRGNQRDLDRARAVARNGAGAGHSTLKDKDAHMAIMRQKQLVAEAKKQATSGVAVEGKVDEERAAEEARLREERRRMQQEMQEAFLREQEEAQREREEAEAQEGDATEEEVEEASPSSPPGILSPVLRAAADPSESGEATDDSQAAAEEEDEDPGGGQTTVEVTIPAVLFEAGVGASGLNAQIDEAVDELNHGDEDGLICYREDDTIHFNGPASAVAAARAAMDRLIAQASRVAGAERAALNGATHDSSPATPAAASSSAAAEPQPVKDCSIHTYMYIYMYEHAPDHLPRTTYHISPTTHHLPYAIYSYA